MQHRLNGWRARASHALGSIPPPVRAAMAWWGAAVLVALALFRFRETAPHGRDVLLWAVILVASVALALAVRRRLSPTEGMALVVLAAALMTDFVNLDGGPFMKDFHTYLTAGAAFIDHGTVYTTTAIHSQPKAGVDYLPFLYAPPTLPVFGLLSELPRGIADALWLAGSVAAALVALRTFGLGWRWAALALLWPPIEQGLYYGNIAIPSLLLLAVAIRVGAALVFGPLLKTQNAIMALWLIRERSWRQLGAGILGLAALALATLPLTGLDLWRNWFDGLFAFQESQRYVPGLYGLGLGRDLPIWAIVVVAAIVLLAALRVGGREGLARLGVASVVASPSLYIHGFVFAIPAILRLRAEWLWLVVGLMAVSPWRGPQAAIAIVIAAWFVKAMTRREDDLTTADRRPLHPLGSAIEPWPVAEG